MNITEYPSSNKPHYDLARFEWANDIAAQKWGENAEAEFDGSAGEIDAYLVQQEGVAIGTIEYCHRTKETIITEIEEGT